MKNVDPPDPLEPQAPHDSSDERFPAVRRGLEQLAGGFDGCRHPGRAWTGDAARRGPVLWKWAAAITAIAAAAALAVHLWHPAVTAPVPAPPTAAIPETPANHPIAPTMPIIPRIIIIEDRDSYSVIDLTTGTPVVAFAQRKNPTFEYIAPLLASSTPAPATQASPNGHL